MTIHQKKCHELSWLCLHLHGTYLPLGYPHLKAKPKCKSDGHFLLLTSTLVIVLSRLLCKVTLCLCFSLRISAWHVWHTPELPEQVNTAYVLFTSIYSLNPPPEREVILFYSTSERADVLYCHPKQLFRHHWFYCRFFWGKRFIFFYFCLAVKVQPQGVL